MTDQRAGRAAMTNKWLRWTIGAAVGVAVGLLGVAIYNSGDAYRCDFAIPDAESHRRWGLTYAAELCDRGDRGLPLPPLNYGGDTPGWEHVGNGWGVLVAAAGFGVLTWLIPLSIGRLQRPARPPRPAPLSAGGRVFWGNGAWRTYRRDSIGHLYVWQYDAQTHTWASRPARTARDLASTSLRPTGWSGRRGSSSSAPADGCVHHVSRSGR